MKLSTVKSLESVISLKKLIFLFSKDLLNWSKVKVNTFILLQKL